MSTDVLGYLASKNLQLKRAPGDEIHMPCLFCDEDPGKRGRLYINVDSEAEIPGLYECKLCGAHGALPTIKRHFGDVTEKEEQGDDGYQRRALLAESATYYHRALNEEVIHWLKTARGLTLDTIIKHQLGFADGGLFRHLREMEFRIADIMATGLVHEDRITHKLADFLHGHVTIPYFSSGNVVMIRGRDLAGGDRKYVTPHGQKTRLFNSDITWEADEVVVCEGEFDSMVLGQIGVAAVAVPGANTWQDGWDGYFSQTRRLYIVFDNDDAGTRGAEKIALRTQLATKTRVVAMPEHDLGQNKVDVSEFIVGQQHTLADFKALLAAAGGGLLITVEEAIAEHAALQNQTGLKFGIEKLDLLLEPGLLKSQVMVILAKSGTGKTVFLLNMFQWIADMQPEAKILFVSLEQTRGDWWERARRIYRFLNVGSSDEDAYRFWRDRIRLVDRNRLTSDQLLTCITDFTEDMGAKPDLVAVDYLGYFAQGFKGDRYERTADAVMSLKAVAKDERLAIVSPHQVNRMTMYGSEPSVDAARDAGVVEETADFVIPLWSPDTQHGRTLEERTGEFKAKIGKSRHGGVGYKHDFVFAPLSLAIVPVENKIYAQFARNELTYQTAYRNVWTQALDRHEAGTSVEEMDFKRVQRALWAKRQMTLDTKGTR